MGILDSIFGGGNEQHSSSSSSLPSWLTSYIQDNLADNNRITQMMRNYQPYSGQRVQGFNQDQQQAFTDARYPAGNIARSMNPYTQQVIDANTADIEREGEHQRLRDQQRASAVGASGGGREGVVNAMREEGVTRQVGNMSAQLRDRGYVNAQGQAQQNIQNLLQTGGMQQNLGQRSLDTAYGDFINQRNWPMTLYGFQQSGLNGTPFSSLGTTQTTSPGANPISQIAGLGLAGYGLGMFG